MVVEYVKIYILTTNNLMKGSYTGHAFVFMYEEIISNGLSPPAKQKIS